MSLRRLWPRLGKQDEARELLAPVYCWCTERFDTAILPAMTLAKEIETTRIHRVAVHTGDRTTHPFHAPHDTSSHAGVIRWSLVKNVTRLSR
jgi:hypothetical protein